MDLSTDMDLAAIKARSDVVTAHLRRYLTAFSTNDYLIQAVLNSNMEPEHKEEVIDLIQTIPDTARLILTVTQGLDEIDRQYPIPEGGRTQ